MNHALLTDSPSLDALIRRIQRKQLLGVIRRWAKLVVGAILLAVVGYGAGRLLSLLAPDSWRAGVTWLGMGVVMGLLLYSARKIKESLYGAAAVGEHWEEDPDGPLSMSLSILPMPDMDALQGGNGPVLVRMQVAAIADILLFPAGWIVQTLGEWKFLKMLGPMDVQRSAGLVQQLIASDKGMDLASLKLSTDAESSLVKNIAHLRLLEMVDRSDKRDRVWLLSRVRDELTR